MDALKSLKSALKAKLYNYKGKEKKKWINILQFSEFITNLFI